MVARPGWPPHRDGRTNGNETVRRITRLTAERGAFSTDHASERIVIVYFATANPLSSSNAKTTSATYAPYETPNPRVNENDQSNRTRTTHKTRPAYLRRSIFGLRAKFPAKERCTLPSSGPFVGYTKPPLGGNARRRRLLFTRSGDHA
jgi:hypothetical protein